MNVAKSDQIIAARSRRPRVRGSIASIDLDFMQQTLPSWKPVLTASIIIPFFFIIGFFLISLGITLLYFSNSVLMHVEDYTYCKPKQASLVTNITCAEIIRNDSNTLEPCTCSIEFSLNENFNGEVYIYYKLTNFYQNHRRYVESRDDRQLVGTFSSQGCSLFNYDPITLKPIVPCGAIANSLFNDTLTLFSKLHGEVPVYNTGIAWPSDKEIKFKNPANLKEALKDKARPISWRKNLWELEPENPDNNGLQNEDFIVWMRVAAFPHFIKLYRRVNHDSQSVFKDGLPSGLYELRIVYNMREYETLKDMCSTILDYPVTQFEGTKSFVLSTISIFGGKYTFLGWTSILVGISYFLLGIVLLNLHIKHRSRVLQLINNTTTRTPYT